MVVPSVSRAAFSQGTSVSLDSSSAVSEQVMVVRGAGIYNFNGVRFSVEILLDRTPDMPLKQPAGTLILDADTLRFPFVCRRWRQGDWFIPLGMRGKKKVSDLFADLKFNALQKDASIIIVDTLTPDLAEQQHIAALLGRRIDDRYKVTPSTRTVLRITVR
jgi:tRNA(Ile)-lysidine synthetase-like protein